MSKGNGDGVSRREFLAGAAALGAASVFGGFATPLFAQGAKISPTKKSRVVFGYSDKMIDAEQRVDQATISKVIEETMVRLTGTKNSTDAWKSLFDKKDVVGIKVNCAAGKALSSKPQMVRSIVDGLTGIGIPAENIIVWERSDGELEGGGFKLNKDKEGYRCYGVQPDVLYEDAAVKSGDHEYRVTKMITQKITALINLPILKDHGTSGVTTALKNHYGSFVIDDKNIYPIHDNQCSPYLAELSAVPAIKDKTRLVLMDAIYCGYEGGPVYVPGRQWYENAIVASADPVAIDAVSWEMIDKARKEHGFMPLEKANRSPIKWLKVAEDMKVGHYTNDMMEKIVWKT